MQIYASLPIFIIIQRRSYKEKQFFFKFLAGVKLTTSGFAVQCIIHWATDARSDHMKAKNAILLNLVSRPLYVFNMAAFCWWQGKLGVYGPFHVISATAMPRQPVEWLRRDL